MATIVVGNGNVTVDEGVVIGSTVNIGNGDDTVTLDAGSTDDTITLGGGNDTLLAAGLTHSTITGANGNSTIIANGVDNTITVGNGKHTVTAGPDSTITLGDGNNTVFSGSASAVTVGNGTATVHAGTSDTITIGHGADLIKYDGLTPTFTVPASLSFPEEGSIPFPITINAPALGHEVVNGFRSNQDVIALDTADFPNFAAVQGAASQVGANTVITLDAGDTITLTNVALSSLSASNFQFFSGAADTITIAGIPSDETLSAGTKNADGSWSLTPGNLPGLTLTAGEPIGYPTPVDVQTTITNPSGQGASSSEDTGVTVNALPPTVGVSVLDNLSTDPVTETRLNITAAPDDPDGGNDVINRVVLSNIPTGVTLSHNGVAIPVVGGDATIAGSSIGSGYEVNVTTPAGQTTNFDLGVTAFSDEPNSPEQSASTSQNIDVEHSSSTQTENFNATNQSIWTTGTAFNGEFKNFLGFTVGPDSGSKSLGFSFGGLTIAGVTIIPSFSVSQTFGGTIFLRSGFESDLNVNAGSFNGTLPYNVTLGDTFNKTTDRLELDPSNSQLGGGSFNTVGPGGSFELDFILDAMAKAFTNGSFGTTSFTIGPYNVDDTLLKKNSSTLSGSFDLPDGIGSVSFAWPQVNAAGNNPSPGTISGHATSNPIFTLNLDPIAIVLDAILGDDPFKGSLLDGHVNYTLLAATLAPAVDLKQAFNLSSSGLGGTLTNATGTTIPFTFGSPVVLNDPTNTDFTFNLSPNATLENDTTLGGLLTVGLRALEGQIKLTLFGTGPTVGFGPLIHPKTTFGPTTLFSLYDKNFAVNFNPQNVHFSIT